MVCTMRVRRFNSGRRHFAFFVFFWTTLDITLDFFGLRSILRSIFFGLRSIRLIAQALADVPDHADHASSTEYA